ncbi:hypothetical protein EV426DRAFT_609171 [Tirmania nivea]|nr:hypothetical protein EV426DRAFT_609171 [Tirmania nivea]
MVRICKDFPDVRPLLIYTLLLYCISSYGGWIGVCLPEEIGGAGLGVAEAVVLVMGRRVCMRIFMRLR